MVSDQKFSMRPLYMQVRDLVLERITSGTWKPGAMLPAEVDLARELGISSGTVRKALDALDAEHVGQEFGLVLGRGVETVSDVAAGAAAADSLAIARGTPVLELDRVVFAIDGRPVEWRVATCHLSDESYVTEFD